METSRFCFDTLEPEQYVTAFEGLRGVHLDKEVLGDGIDEFFSDLRPPLVVISERISRLGRVLMELMLPLKKLPTDFVPFGSLMKMVKHTLGSRE